MGENLNNASILSVASDRFDQICCLSRRILYDCVVHEILPSNVLSMVIWPQNQLRTDFLPSHCRQGLHCHPSPNTHLVNFPDSGRHVTSVNQGPFHNDNGGREERTWERGRFIFRKFTEKAILQIHNKAFSS